MNASSRLTLLVVVVALMLALIAPSVMASFAPSIMHKAKILDIMHRAHGGKVAPPHMALPGGQRVSSVDETFEAVRSMMEAASSEKLLSSVQAAGNNLTVFQSATSCNATQVGSVDLSIFSKQYGKCLSYPGGSLMLALCSSVAGGTTSFALGEFSVPNCPNTDKNSTVLIAGSTPTDKTGCFVLSVVTPTVSGTLGAQVQCPPQ